VTKAIQSLFRSFLRSLKPISNNFRPVLVEFRASKKKIFGFFTRLFPVLLVVAENFSMCMCVNPDFRPGFDQVLKSRD
jgi:hypothetical protein